MSSPRAYGEFLLEARDLAVRRGARLILENLDFSLKNGEALALTGPNGVGKSSLLRLVAGLLAPAHGQILLNGADSAEEPEALRALSAYHGHLTALKPGLSVAANLDFWVRLRGQPVGRVPDALALFGVEALADMPVRLLSEGQKRRAALARMAASGATLWLLDEPITALDAQAQKLFDNAVNQHLAAGGVVIAATHSPLALFGAQILPLADYAAAGPGMAEILS